MLLFITGMTIFWVVRFARGKGTPEELALPTWSPPKVVGLLPIGVALLLLFSFSRDTTSYWRLAASLLWLLIGSFVLLGPSFSQLSDGQRVQLAKSMARTWWVLPASVVVSLVGFLLLTLFAPRWAVSGFATACLCAFSIEITWSFLRLRSVLREGNG